jgi:hypothetical protein
MPDDKRPTLEVKGRNIKPDTLGEVAWASMQEYCDKIGHDALDQPLGGSLSLAKAALGSVIESQIILAANKLGLDLIDMLGMIERAKANILKQVEAQQARHLYQRAAAEVAAKQKEAASGPDLKLVSP